MNAKLLSAVLALAAAAAAAGCSPSDGKTAEAQKPPVAVDVVTVAAADQVEAIDVVGSLEPKFTANVKSEYSGIVTAVHVAQWVPVRKGQPLASLDVRESKLTVQKARAGVDSARASMLQAEVRLRQAEREADRSTELKAAGLATQQQLDDALTMRDAARAQVEAARGQVTLAEEEVRHAETRLDKAVIRSPLDGVVALRVANPGDLVGEPGTAAPMFQVVDNRLLDLTVPIPAARLADVQVGQALTFTTESYGSRVFEGKVAFINPTVDAASRTVKVVAEVPNPENVLRGGMFVRGRIVVGERSGVLQAPRTALLNWDVLKKSGELFVVEGEVARRRTVQTGRVAGDAVEIASGLRPGEQVVARGAFNLRDGDRILVAGRGN